MAHTHSAQKGKGGLVFTNPIGSESSSRKAQREGTPLKGLEGGQPETGGCRQLHHLTLSGNQRIQNLTEAYINHIRSLNRKFHHLILKTKEMGDTVERKIFLGRETAGATTTLDNPD